MQKLVSTLIFIFFINILPLIFKPELIIQLKPLTILAVTLIMFLTQPAFSIQETKNNKTTDRFSIVIILLASALSVSSSLVEWAYFKHSESNLFITCFGIFMFIIGLFLRIYSIVTLGKYFTATAHVTNEHSLIQSGPYSLIRHPSYTGAIVVMIGAPIFLNNIITIFSTIIFLTIAYTIRIRFEEKMLISVFGTNYINYSKRVKKLFPYIW